MNPQPDPARQALADLVAAVSRLNARGTPIRVMDSKLSAAMKAAEEILDSAPVSSSEPEPRSLESVKPQVTEALRSLLDSVEQSTYANGGQRVWGLIGGSSLCSCATLASSHAALALLEQMPVSPARPARDGEVIGWACRHGISDLSLSALRAAFEDARSLELL